MASFRTDCCANRTVNIGFPIGFLHKLFPSFGNSRKCFELNTARLCNLSSPTRPVQQAQVSLHAVSDGGGDRPIAATAPPSAPSALLLSDIRVVLVAPKHETNVGAVARVCANFECLSLYLVAPRCAIATSGTGAGFGEARKVACGDIVLDRLVVTDTLVEALADTNGSIGFTRRAGATRVTHASLGHLLAEFPWALPLPPLPETSGICAAGLPERSLPSIMATNSTPVEAALQQPALSGQQPGPISTESALSGRADARESSGHRPCTIALVFGREESGLTEAELRLCSHACAIPTGRLQPSMNLSHAVAVVMSELFSRRCGLLNVISSEEVVQTATVIDGDDERSGTGLLVDTSGTISSCQTPSLSAWSGCEATSVSAVEHVPATTCIQPVPATSSYSGTSNTVTAAAVATGTGARGSGATVSGGTMVDASMLLASTQEVDLLVQKVAAAAEAVGMRGEESIGGGGSGNHGRRRLPVGHLRSVLSRARMNAAESRSLHGLASAVLQRLDPDHHLEARKVQRKQQQAQQAQTQKGQEQQQLVKLREPLQEQEHIQLAR